MFSQEAKDAMGRRRHQTPTLKRSKTKDGKNDRWWFRGYIDVRSGPGETQRIEKSFPLGYCAEMGKREAMKLMAQKVTDLNRPVEILQSQVLFGELLGKWLEMMDVRDSTREGYVSVVEAHLRPKWGKTRMCDMTALAVEEWIKGKTRGLAENTVTHIRRTFSQVWKCGLRWDFTSKANPMNLIPRPKNYGAPARSKKLPTPQEFRLLLAGLRSPHREIVIFATGTGLRISEILALRWGQFGGDFITISASKDQRGKIDDVKTPKSNRVIPVKHLQMARPLDAAANDFVFPTNYSAVQYAITTAAAAIGIYYPGFGIHTCRRMHNTLFRRAADGRLDLAQKQLGHADQAINDLYYIEDDSDLAERAKISEKMMGEFMGRVN
jgi:integrase